MKLFSCSCEVIATLHQVVRMCACVVVLFFCNHFPHMYKEWPYLEHATFRDQEYVCFVSSKNKLFHNKGANTVKEKVLN